MATSTDARPFLPEDVILRMVEGTANEAEQRRVAGTFCRLADTIHGILRNGVRARDVEIMERAAATTEAIHDALFEAQCRRTRAALSADPWGGCGDPVALVQRIAGPLTPVGIAR